MSFFCGFCQKGPFPTEPGLRRHITHSSDCRKKARQEFGSYATSIWNTDHPPDDPIGLDDTGDDPSPALDLPDITLDADLQAAEQVIDDQEEPPVPVQPTQPQGRSMSATVEDVPDEDDETEKSRYIEDFPAEFKAGAVWGVDQPSFESIKQTQEENGTSRCGPFKNEEEWELAEWLIRNVGKKQADVFLKLPIVCNPVDRRGIDA